MPALAKEFLSFTRIRLSSIFVYAQGWSAEVRPSVFFSHVEAISHVPGFLPGLYEKVESSSFIELLGLLVCSHIS